MAAKIYLVRLKDAYCFNGDDRFPRFAWPCVRGAFSTREAAERYARTHFPAEFTPLDSTNWDIGENVIVLGFYDNVTDFDEPAIFCDLNELAAWLKKEGFPKPPPRLQLEQYLKKHQRSVAFKTMERDFHLWWQEQRGLATPEQNLALWNLLDPRPYRIVEIESNL